MTDQRNHLINDATGLPRRFELLVDGQWWVVGARVNDAVSVFAGEDFVMQFTAHGELRRLFADGVRYKAVDGRLVRAGRADSRGSLRLQASDLSAEESLAMTERIGGSLEQLRDLLAGAAPDQAPQHLGRTVGPEPLTFVAQIVQWVSQQCAQGLVIASKPNVE